MDRFINNLTPRILFLIFLLLLALSAAAADLAAGKCADIIVAGQIEAELSAVGGGKFTGAPEEASVAEGETLLKKYSINRNLPPEIMNSYPGVKRLVFHAVFGLMAALSAVWFAVSVHKVMSVYRDLEKLHDECLKAAYDAKSEISLYGEELSSVRRVCESAELLVERMRYTSLKLSREQEFLRTFLTDLSHQIKTSLAVVRLNADMLSELDGLSEEHRARLSDEIQLNLDGMEQLVIEAIKLAKLNANAVEYSMDTYSVSEVFELAVRRITPLLRNRGISVNNGLPKDTELLCDKGWLCEAVENILKNSADHSECTEISAELKQNSVMTTLVISDNGKGIPQEEVPKLFERFSSASGDRTMHSSGLGMSIAQKIIRAHNGEIFVYTEKGQGTRFEFVFLGS